VEVYYMSQNAFRDADWDALAEILDPDVLVRTDPSWPEQRFYGRETVIAFWRGVRESWGPDTRDGEIVDLGDPVLGRTRYIVHGQHSGAGGEQSVSTIWTFCEGQIMLVEYFLNHADAVKAVGLEDG
jgi:hypothetical protein